ncbi:male sterility protein-domain-containing protein [Halenospora varia]|nr:male sterility protein-domain-containing protein [Halenospora varia]
MKSARPSTSGSQTFVSSTPAPPQYLNDDPRPEEVAVRNRDGKKQDKKMGIMKRKKEKTRRMSHDEKCDEKVQKDEKTETDVGLPEPSKPSTSIPEQPLPPPPPATIFLTGATGFLGKVVLSELLRQSIDYTIIKIIILVRTKNKKSARARFLRELYKSSCFSDLSSGWPRLVQVVEGDLVKEKCGLEEAVYNEICGEVTHVVHCAGSNKFSLPMKEAVRMNVESTINVFELAKSSPELEQLVITSSAYSSPNQDTPIREEFMKLPLSAKEIMMVIEGGRMEEEKLLMSTGHGHSLGLSKCVAENWVLERIEELDREREDEERRVELERIAEMEEKSVEIENESGEVEENGEENEEGAKGDNDENGTKDESNEVVAEREGEEEEDGKDKDNIQNDEHEEEAAKIEPEIPSEKGFEVKIIRPSLLGPSKQYPHPGWCEGAGIFISLMGCISKGALRVLDGDPNTPLNVVPVDQVAAKLIQAAFPPPDSILVEDAEPTTARREETRMKILFAVSPATQSFTTRTLTETIISYVHTAHPYPGKFNKPKITYIGPKGGRFKLHTTVHQKLPVLVKKALCAVRSNDDVKIEVEKAGRVVKELVLELGRSGILRGRGWDFRPDNEVI